MIYAGLGACLVSSLLWVAGLKLSSKWESRGMDNLSGKWHLLFALGTLLAIGSAVGAIALGAPILGAIGLSIIAWLIPLVSATDFTTLLIPREISVLAYYLPLPLIVVFIWQEHSWTPLINFGIWFIAVALFFIPVLMGRMGMGDLRLFILFGTALAWWTGPYHIVLGLLGAAIIQIILFIIAVSTKKIGVYRVITPIADEVDISITLEESDVERRISARHKADTAENTPQVQKKKRLFLPFGPALLYGALLAGLFAAYMPYEELIDHLIM